MSRIHPRWHQKFMQERRRRRDDPKQILPLENAFMLCKLEGIHLFQDSLLEELEAKLREHVVVDNSRGLDIKGLIYQEVVEQVIEIVKGLVPKEYKPNYQPLKDASKLFTK